MITPYHRKRLRTDYNTTWSRDWPEDDEYLTELWFEAKKILGIPHSSRKFNVEEVCTFVLTLMRECHDFEVTKQEPLT